MVRRPSARGRGSWAADPRYLVERTGRGVDVRAPQLGGEQMPTAEHVQRQIAEAIVVAVKELPFLMTVQGIVGGIDTKPIKS